MNARYASVRDTSPGAFQAHSRWVKLLHFHYSTHDYLVTEGRSCLWQFHFLTCIMKLAASKQCKIQRSFTLHLVATKELNEHRKMEGTGRMTRLTTAKPFTVHWRYEGCMEWKSTQSCIHWRSFWIWKHCSANFCAAITATHLNTSCIYFEAFFDAARWSLWPMFRPFWSQTIPSIWE